MDHEVTPIAFGPHGGPPSSPGHNEDGTVLLNDKAKDVASFFADGLGAVFTSCVLIAGLVYFLHRAYTQGLTAAEIYILVILVCVFGAYVFLITAVL